MDNDGYKKDQMVLIVASGKGSHDLHVRLQAHIEDMQKEMEKFKVALVDLGEAGIAGAAAGLALSEAFRAMPIVDYPDRIAPNIRCPPEMIETLELDFSRLERIVIDSLAYDGPSFPTKFAEQCYDESGVISKKAYKRLKKLAKRARVEDEPKPQNEIWANKWNKKIKRKL